MSRRSAVLSSFALAAGMVAVAIYLLASTWTASEPPPPPLTPRGGPIYFVPLGTPDPPGLDSLAANLSRRYAIDIRVLDPLALDAAAVDNKRRQVIAEAVIDLMKRGYPAEAADSTAVLVGMTAHDLYIAGHTSWRFAFSFRQDDRFAVVSTARMDDANLGRRANPQLLETRLRKMVTKNLGIMYFGLAQSTSRRSVLYGPTLGVDDLDRIGEDFWERGVLTRRVTTPPARLDAVGS
jgi:predicted Zn-dependent protease